MFQISMWEIGLILVVALIVLGPRQLMETAKVVGRLYRELLKLTSELKNHIDLDSPSSHYDSHTAAPAGRAERQEHEADHAEKPPAEERSGPDFYADLLESSREEEAKSEPGGNVAEKDDAKNSPKNPSGNP